MQGKLRLKPGDQFPALRRMQLLNEVILPEQVATFSSCIQWQHLYHLSLLNQNLDELLPVFADALTAQAHGLLQSIELRASRKEKPDRSIAAAKRFLEHITGLTTFICYDFPLKIVETLAHYHQGSLKHLQFCYTRCGGKARLNRGELLQYPGLRFPENPDDEVQSILNNIDKFVEWFPHLESLELNLPRQQKSVYHALSSLSRLQKLRHLNLNISAELPELDGAHRNPPWDMSGEPVQRSLPSPLLGSLPTTVKSYSTIFLRSKRNSLTRR